MGWMCTHKDKSESVTDFIAKSGVLRFTQVGFEYKILASVLVARSEHYAAIERVETATGKREVWASVILIDLAKVAGSNHNICYKDMDETANPYYVRCPARILDLLTPTENELALEWRKNCRALLAEKAAIPAFKPGLKLEFQKPVTFPNGFKATELEVEYTEGARVYVVEPKSGNSSWLSKAKVKDLIFRGFVTIPV